MSTRNIIEAANPCNVCSPDLRSTCESLGRCDTRVRVVASWLCDKYIANEGTDAEFIVTTSHRKGSEIQQKWHELRAALKEVSDAR